MLAPAADGVREGEPGASTFAGVADVCTALASEIDSAATGCMAEADIGIGLAEEEDEDDDTLEWPLSLLTDEDADDDDLRDTEAQMSSLPLVLLHERSGAARKQPST